MMSSHVRLVLGVLRRVQRAVSVSTHLVKRKKRQSDQFENDNITQKIGKEVN